MPVTSFKPSLRANDGKENGKTKGFGNDMKGMFDGEGDGIKNTFQPNLFDNSGDNNGSSNNGSNKNGNNDNGNNDGGNLKKCALCVNVSTRFGLILLLLSSLLGQRCPYPLYARWKLVSKYVLVERFRRDDTQYLQRRFNCYSQVQRKSMHSSCVSFIL